MATTSVSKLLIRLQKFSSKVSKVIEATDSFNQYGSYYQDLSGWDSAVVQFVTPSAEVTFYTTNDDDSVTGQLLPSPEQPNNWVGVTGVNLLDKSDVTSFSTDGLVEFGIIGKYLLLLGAETTASPFAYNLSKNTYSNATEAYNIGVLQGNRIVYASTNTLNGSSKLFADSRLTQPIYGDGTNWYGVQLLNNGVKYAITIDGTGAIVID
jgi:hypothetical protein